MVGVGFDFGYEDPDVDALLEKVRFDLLNPPHNEATDWGLFVSMRPYQIARALTGNDVLEMTFDIDEALLAKAHLGDLGQRVASFYREFVARRERSGRKRGALEPSPDELRQAFGADAALVDAAWPMVARIDAILSLRARRDVGPEERAAQEAALWEGGATLVAAAKPNRYVLHPPSATSGGDPELGEGLKAFVRRRVERIAKRRRWQPREVDEVTQKVLIAFDEGTIQRRLLAVRAGIGGEEAFKQFRTLIGRLIRDMAPATVTVMFEDGDGPKSVKVSASTMRGLRHRKKIGEHPSGEEVAHALNEGRARRAHHDPTGATVTGSELARRWGRKVRTVNKVIASSTDLGTFKKKRGCGYQIPDRPALLALLRARLPDHERRRESNSAKGVAPPPRKPTRKPRVREIAEECGVSVDVARQACRDFRRLDESAVDDLPWGEPDSPRFPMRALTEEAAEALRAVISHYAKPTT